MARRRKAKEEDTESGVMSHDWILQQLEAAQKADHDNREKAREAAIFVHQRGGQWEQRWWERSDGKPRYEFDLVSPILDQVQKTMDKLDYEIKVLPAGGGASEDVAAVYDGIVRNIQAISNARETFSKSGRGMVLKGLDGWEVEQKYCDGDSFDQDLVISKVPNFLDSVWFGPHTEQDASDARMAWKLVGLTPEDFKAKYPDRSVSASVGSDVSSHSYYDRTDLVMIGQFYYLEDSERELVMMSNGNVYEVDDKFKAMQDELEAAGITEMRRRKRTKSCVYIRKFDVNGWIDDKPKKTVFENWLPLVPLYANFDFIDDSKLIYYGAVEKLLDPQRVFNYTLSREIEEGALSPRAKYWMTKKQAAGHEKKLATLNTNSDPVQFYNPDPEANAGAPPSQLGGAQINPGLSRISEAMQSLVGMTAGMFAANMGDNPGLQSGKAIEALQDRGDAGSNKYVEARTIAQRQTGRILVDAIPRVYLPERQVRILSEDGSFDMETLGAEVIDQQTGQKVILNDLNQGQYDVTCSVGPGFQNRQSQTVTALTEVGAIDPSVIEIGGDILLKNIASPGMDLLAARKRQQLFAAGLIPQDQLTKEEAAQLEQMQQQPPQEDPNMVLARAEEGKAQAAIIDAQTKQMDSQIKAQDSQTKQAEVSLAAQNKQQELQIRAYEAETERAKVLREIEAIEAKTGEVLAKTEQIKVNSALDVAGAFNSPL